jgi:hypothetical protein
LNPTGGGKRNSFGNIITQTELPRYTISSSDLYSFANLFREEGPPSEGSGQEGGPGSKKEGEAPKVGEGMPGAPSSTFYTGYLTSFLSLGGNFRFNNRTIWRKDDSVSNSFAISEGNVYGSIELLEGVLSLYLDETVAPGGAASREAFLLLRGPWTTYLKAGRMMLPYGLRLQDDTAFIREITGFNYGVQDLGVEVGAEPGPFSISFAVSNGSQGSTDDNTDKQICGMASYIQRYWRVGAQGTVNNTSAAKRTAAGGFAGINIGRFTLLGELDYITDEAASTEHKLLLYGAVNYLLTKGVNLQLAYDFADPDRSQSEDTFERVSFGIEFFVTQFTQVRAFYRFRDDVKTSPRDNESVLDIEVHLFF